MIRAVRGKVSVFSSSLPTPSWIEENYLFQSTEADFIPKRVVVLRIHETVARFLAGMEFSTRYSNRGELAPV